VGTRADFYVGRGPNAEWIGSIAFDGYPDGITMQTEEKWPWPQGHKHINWPEGKHLFDAATEAEYRERVERFFRYRKDVTRPEQGWPWPWDNGNTTNYSYAFDGGKVYVTCFGHGWNLAGEEPEDDEDAPKIPGSEWPDMSAKKNVVLGGNRSGLILMVSEG